MYFNKTPKLFYKRIRVEPSVLELSEKYANADGDIVFRSIRKMLDDLDVGGYRIPQIQRDGVWKPKVVYDFYDSLMKNYFVGTMMFWESEKQDSEGLGMSRDIRENLKKQKSDFEDDFEDDDESKSSNSNDNNKKNRKSLKNRKEFVFDGQQRLTALYSGFVDENPDFEKKPLFINLFSGYKHWKLSEMGGNKTGDIQKFDFNFGKPGKRKKRQILEYWVKFNIFVKKNGESSRIREIREEAEEYIKEIDEDKEKIAQEVKDIWGGKKGRDQGVEEIKKKGLALLDHTIKRAEHVPAIRIQTYKISGPVLQAIELFRKINNGGKKVSGSQLMLCFFWAIDINMRNECIKIVKSIKKYGVEINEVAMQDFLMRLSCYISEESIDFSSENIEKSKVFDALEKIAKNWQKISQIFKYVVKLFNSYGLLIPMKKHRSMLVVAFYLYRCNYDKDSFDKLMSDKKSGGNWRTIKNWMSLSILEGTFSKTKGNPLKKAQRVIESKGKKGKIYPFPAKELVEELGQTINKQKIQDLFNKMTKNHVYALFSLIDDGNNNRGSHPYEIDHIYPKSKFPGNDHFLNYQLLSVEDNKNKSDEEPDQWLKKLKKTLEQLKAFLEDQKIYSFEVDEEAEVEDLLSELFKDINEFFKKRREYLYDIVHERCQEIGAFS